MSDSKALSPMETFQERLKASLRDDIARMLPDEAVADMIKRVVEEEFFTKRKVKDPRDTNSFSPRMIEKPTIFQEIVIEAVKPIMARHALEMVARHSEEIRQAIDAAVRAGVLNVCLSELNNVILGALTASQYDLKAALRQAFQNKGMDINIY